MTESNNFLKFLINEDIYVIDEVDKNALPAESNEENKESVVEAQPETSTGEESERANSLSENSKQETLVLFDNPSGENLDDPDLNYLEKILGAIGKSTDEVDFLNVASNKPEVETYKYVIAFTPNHQLPIEMSAQQYTVLSIANAKLIVADSLKNISASTDLRKKLWSVLQQVFIA